MVLLAVSQCDPLYGESTWGPGDPSSEWWPLQWPATCFSGELFYNKQGFYGIREKILSYIVRNIIAHIEEWCQYIAISIQDWSTTFLWQWNYTVTIYTVHCSGGGLLVVIVRYYDRGIQRYPRTTHTPGTIQFVYSFTYFRLCQSCKPYHLQNFIAIISILRL